MDKFQLFEGVFGASDGVLGDIDALDFERRVVEIYQFCRTADEIERSFNALRKSLEPVIEEEMESVRQKLLENFDDVVAERLKMNYNNSAAYLDKYDKMLWELTRYFLDGSATFTENDGVKSFELKHNPFGQWYSPVKQVYTFDKSAPKAQRYRLNSPLAKKMIQWIGDGVLDNVLHGEHYLDGEVTFDISNHPTKITDIINLKGQSGYLMFNRISVKGLDREDILIFTGYTDDGKVVEGDILERMFGVSAVDCVKNIVGKKNDRTAKSVTDEHYNRLYAMYADEKQAKLNDIAVRNSDLFDEEIEKLDNWAKDVKQSLERDIKNLDKEISSLKKEVRKITKFAEKIEAQKKITELEAKRNQNRFDLFSEQDKIDKQKEQLIENTSKRMEQKITEQLVFTIKWRII